MTAYTQMLFTQMTEAERKLMTSSLLHYSELDTLAMV